MHRVVAFLAVQIDGRIAGVVNFGLCERFGEGMGLIWLFEAGDFFGR